MQIKLLKIQLRNKTKSKTGIEKKIISREEATLKRRAITKTSITKKDPIKICISEKSRVSKANSIDRINRQKVIRQ